MTVVLPSPPPPPDVPADRALSVEADAGPEREAPVVNVLGVGVRPQNIPRAAATIADWVDTRTRTYVCVAAVHSVVESRRSPALRRIHNAAGMVTSDGMPLVWLCRAAGHRDAERVYGPDLMLAVCAESLNRGRRHFLYGGSDAVLERLKANLEARFPGLQIVGAHAPPFRPLTAEEDVAVVDKINAAQPDIVWVGLGAPKQEYWMAAHLGRISAPVMVGVGAAFDFHAGTKRQAPQWMRGAGLEWLFRLLNEPRRLAYRYLVANPLFVFYLVLQVLGLRRFPLTDCGSGQTPTENRRGDLQNRK